MTTFTIEEVRFMFVPVNEPLLAGNEKAYLNQCIESGWISSEGSFVARFEDAVASRIGRRHAVAVCNGTAALEIAIAALGIGVGDEVILPSFTIISCAAAIVRQGAIPVVVDCEFNTWNMDVSAIEDKITPKTKAIMVVHIYGLPVDMDQVIDMANKHGLYVVEDAAQAIGLKYKEKACGSFGDISTFSFYPNKHITTGEGGMVLTDSLRLAERCKGIRNLCFQSKRFLHDELGWNYRMSNIQAAVGLAQLEQLDAHLIKKQSIATRYNEAFADLVNVQLPQRKTPYAENGYWVYGMVLGNELNSTNDNIIEQLSEKGVGTRPFFWPMHEQPVFKRMGLFMNEKHLHSESLARKGFYIPSGLGLTETQQTHVINVVREVLS